jgi:hypothetical protein
VISHALCHAGMVASRENVAALIPPRFVVARRPPAGSPRNADSSQRPAIYVVFQRFSVLAGLGAVGCVLGNPFSYEYGWALPSPHPSLLFPSGRRSLP